MRLTSKPTFLIGLPGSGKSTVGRLLAEKLGTSFKDLDEIVAEKEGAAISLIFEKKGEAYFRQTESECLYSLIMSGGNSIISTGGGTPCFFQNMRRMQHAGITCYLRVSWQTIASRLGESAGDRPLLAGLSADQPEATLRQKFSWRLPFYEQSQLTVKADNRSPDQVAELLLASLIKHKPQSKQARS